MAGNAAAYLLTQVPTDLQRSIELTAGDKDWGWKNGTPSASPQKAVLAVYLLS